MKKLMILTGALAAFAVCADEVPEVSDITMTQGNASRLVTINYKLANAAAVVTLDIQTNSTAGTWASIGGENIQNVSGDVWKKVEIGPHTISWRPDISWPDHKIKEGGARAVVTAWSVDNPPDYLVADISPQAQPNTETYYPAVEFLPGGVTNALYRETMLVMRKIPAKGVTWTMGSDSTEPLRATASSVSTREIPHLVTLTNNYYLGIFEVTQAQWSHIQTAYTVPSGFSGAPRAHRPVENVCYNEIRNAAGNTQKHGGSQYDWPNDPNPGSFLGLLRTKTGLGFDLPSEAQWEFACRAGVGSGYLYDGSPILNDSSSGRHLNRLARWYYNDGWVCVVTNVNGAAKYESPSNTVGPTNGTAVVGSYLPNPWGLYDMLGNVCEFCLDWGTDNISTLGGAVNIDPTDPSKALVGTTGQRIVRGGNWNDNAGFQRPASRDYKLDTRRDRFFGFRVALPLK